MLEKDNLEISESKLQLDSVSTSTLTVKCDYCDRNETFENIYLARAWLSGHIKEEHPDELPEFKNTECLNRYDWCSGPDASLKKGVAFGGICYECLAEKQSDES